jgi:hypothetical protein
MTKDLAGTFESNSANNLIGKDGNMSNGINNGTNNNQVGGQSGGAVIDPLLGALTDNGGPTTTHALLTDSPAIDKGSDTAASGLLYDQRGPGFNRTIDGGIEETVDVGAFEYDPGSGSGSGGAALAGDPAAITLSTTAIENLALFRPREFQQALREVALHRLPIHFDDQDMDALLLTTLNVEAEASTTDGQAIPSQQKHSVADLSLSEFDVDVEAALGRRA